MKNKILAIDEITGITLNTIKHYTFSGYKITLEGDYCRPECTEIFIVIEDGQASGEEFGYLTTNDDLSEYIGCTVKSLNAVDVVNGKYLKNTVLPCGVHRSEAVFVNIEVYGNTPLQFAVYNSHNGFYGHQVVISSEHLYHYEVL